MVSTDGDYKDMAWKFNIHERLNNARPWVSIKTHDGASAAKMQQKKTPPSAKLGRVRAMDDKADFIRSPRCHP
jgi:hypothetical protein